MIGKIVLGLIAIIALVIFSVFGYLAYSNAPTVTAEGTNTITAQPDEVNVNIYISQKNATAEDARNRLAEISDELLTSLIKLGLERKDIQTEQVSVNPDYNWYNGRNEIRGYVASQSITVKLKDFNKISKVIDSAVDSGAYVSWINYEISDEKQSQYKSQTLEAATRDAKRKAEATASGLGKKLGSLVSIQTPEYGYNPYPLYRYSGAADMAVASVANAEAKQAALNIQPKDLEISSRVLVKYRVCFW